MGDPDQIIPAGTIVARERELNAILLVAATSRTHGGTVLVTGEAGVGKTTLLGAAVDRLDGWRVLRAQADSFESDLSFSTVDAFMRSIGHPRASEEGVGAQPDATAVGRALLDALDTRDDSEMPVCIVIDDVQWADAASAQALRFALRRLEGLPVLILAAGRSVHGDLAEFLQSQVAAAPGSGTRIELAPFTAADTQALAVALLSRNISRRTAEQLTRTAGGSPLLLTMLLRQARDSLEHALHPSGIDVAAPAQNPLSTQVVGALDTLADPARTAAEIAAVLRDPTAVAVMGTIADMLGESSDADGARRVDLLRLRQRGDSTIVEPNHALLADAIVGQLSLERRRSIHRAAAQVLTGHHALRHRVEAAERTDADLASVLVVASLNAAEHGRSDQAMSYARSAIQLAPAGHVHENALLNIGLLAMRFRAHQRIFDLIPAIEQVPVTPVRDVILVELYTLIGDLSAAFARADAVLTDPREDGDTRLVKAHAACAVPKVQLATGSFAPVIEQVRRARAFVEAAPALPSHVTDPALRWMAEPQQNVIRLLGWSVSAAARTGNLQVLQATMAELDELLAHSSDSAAVADALVVQARVRIASGDLLRVRDDLERANRLIRQFPTAWTAGHARTIYAHVLFLLGEFDASVTVADTAVALALDETDLSGWPLALAVSSLVRAARAEEGAVFDRLQKISNEPHVGAGAYDPDLPTIARAELARAQGKPAQQLAATADRRSDAPDGSALGWLTYRIDALALLGRAEEARLALVACRAPGSRWTPAYGSLAWLEGRIAESLGDHQGALVWYQRACADENASLYPFPLAVAELDYGRMLRVSGSQARAAASIGMAAETFRRLGATTYLARCNAELESMRDHEAGTSSDPRRTRARLDPFAPLTTRERQVAHAIATGLTNREVAELLYVSVTTVNFHVRNILTKLGIASRRALRSLTAEQPSQRQQRPHPHGPVNN